MTAHGLERDDYEALVIGSGFGGAVAACRLAQAGIDGAIVERGRRYPAGSFPRDLTKLDAGWLWSRGQGLFDVRPWGDIICVQAAGFGGGSLVYANVAMRPPEEVFEAFWPHPSGTRSVLRPRRVHDRRTPRPAAPGDRSATSQDRTPSNPPPRVST
jgi:cholesterol oxidase